MINSSNLVEITNACAKLPEVVEYVKALERVVLATRALTDYAVAAPGREQEFHYAVQQLQYVNRVLEVVRD